MDLISTSLISNFNVPALPSILDESPTRPPSKLWKEPWGNKTRTDPEAQSPSAVIEEKTSLLNSTPIFRNDIIDQDSLAIAHVSDDESLDDTLIPPWKRCVVRFFALTSFIPPILVLWTTRIQAWALAGYYWGQEYAPVNRLVLAWTLVGLEFLLSIDVFLHATVKACATTGTWRPRLRLLGDNVPSVDVIVTVCNEKLDIVRDTVRAVLNIDYPRHRFRVIVSDDGHSARLQAWVAQLALETPNLHYTARIKHGPAGFKAGNLNHAISLAETLPGGPGEFVSCLDADMIPERRWLRSVAAHIVRDLRMGLVCPTQVSSMLSFMNSHLDPFLIYLAFKHFYNIPTHDPLYQSNSLIWRCFCKIYDLAGCAWNVGSGWIMRREAWVDTGGFPTDCLIEDVCSSMLVLGEGWKTAFVSESLQWGLVPETYRAHVTQYTRWYIGGCQMSLRFRLFLDRSLTKCQTTTQRIVGLATGVTVHTKPHFSTLCLIVMPIVFLSNTNLAYYQDIDQFRLLLRLECAIVLFRLLHDFHLSVMTGLRAVIKDMNHNLYMSPYFTLAYIESFVLPTSLGGKATGFTPTGSIGNTIYERDPARRAPLLTRLHHILFQCKGWMQLAAAISLAICASIRISRTIQQASDTVPRGLWIELVKNVAWPSNQWFLAMIACLTPIEYAIFPPVIPERDKLLGNRGENAARYPTTGARREDRTTWKSLFVESYVLYHLYVLIVLVGSWWV